jgi:hypothetical protein
MRTANAVDRSSLTVDPVPAAQGQLSTHLDRQRDGEAPPTAPAVAPERPSAIRRMMEARRQRRLAKLAKLAPPIVAVVSVAESRPAHAYMGDQLLNTASTYFIAPLFILSVVCAGVASLFRPEYVKTAAYSAFICVAIFGVIKLAQPLMSAVSA